MYTSPFHLTVTTFSTPGPRDYRIAYLDSVAVIGGTPQQVASDVDSAPTFSPDGRQLVTLARYLPRQRNGDQVLTVWDIDRAAKARELSIYSDLCLDSRATFDATGDRVVVAGLDRAIRWYDAATLTEQLIMRGTALEACHSERSEESGEVPDSSLRSE